MRVKGVTVGRGIFTCSCLWGGVLSSFVGMTKRICGDYDFVRIMSERWLGEGICGQRLLSSFFCISVKGVTLQFMRSPSFDKYWVIETEGAVLLQFVR